MDQQQPGQQAGAQPQYSPDGKWWWDGQRWVAVQPSAPGAGGPGAPKRKRGPGLWIGLAAALVVLLGVCTVAVANSGSSSTRTSARASTSPTAPPARATAAPTAAAPARDGSCSPQPCANDNYGWVVNVSNIRYGAQASEFDKPESGNVFVMVDVTFTNKLDQEQHANPTEFVLTDGGGIKHTWRPMVAGGCATWEPVNLTKGATLGPKCLSFEAAAGKPSPLALTWTPSGFGGGYAMKLT